MINNCDGFIFPPDVNVRLSGRRLPCRDVVNGPKYFGDLVSEQVTIGQECYNLISLRVVDPVAPSRHPTALRAGVTKAFYDEEEVEIMEKRLTDSFVRQADGRWKCIESVTLSSPKAILFRPGMTWGPEDSYMGIKVAKLLDSLVETRRAGS